MTRNGKPQEREPAPAGREPPAETGHGLSHEMPPAGPHAQPDLTNPEATPGAGALPDPCDPADSADSTSG